MFCPNCKSEYRFGVTKCSDCGADLVEHLSDSSSDAGAEEMEILWSGTDPEFAELLREELDRAELQHRDDSVELGFLRAFRGAVFKVSVRSGDKEAAERVLQVVMEGKATEPPRLTADFARDAATLNPYRGLTRRVSKPPDKRAAPFEYSGLFGSESASDPTPDDIVENFDPDQATCEVWSGEDQQIAENFRICLREVGIGSDVRQANGKSQVLVLPQADARAREVIREIIEATPPE